MVEPNTIMKAVRHEKYGLPDVLKIVEAEKPVPKQNELLVRVHATTVNRTDSAMLMAKPYIMRLFTGLFKPSKTTTGSDFAGAVEAIGKDVVEYKVGDKVFGFDDLGLRSHAQYMVIAQHKGLTTMPENIGFEEAVSCIEGVHYAYNFINKIPLQAGQKALVNGASGAIGSAAVQLLKYFGAEVTAVCSTKNIDLMRSLGADKVIDFTCEDFTRTEEKYHYVLDAVGKSSFAKCKPLLLKKGIYISSELGKMSQNPILAVFTPISGGKKVVFPIPFNIKNSVLLVKKLMLEGKYTAVIDRKYSLNEIADAYRYVQTGQKTGSVVLVID